MPTNRIAAEKMATARRAYLAAKLRAVGPMSLAGRYLHGFFDWEAEEALRLAVADEEHCPSQHGKAAIEILRDILAAARAVEGD